MAKTKKRTAKKHNPAKYVQKMFAEDIDRILDNLLLCWAPTRKSVEAFTSTGAPLVSYGENIHNFIMAKPQFWSSYYMVVCKKPCGTPYYKLEYAEAVGSLVYTDAAKVFNELHQELISSCVKSHICATAWINSPRYQPGVSDKVIDSMLTKLGVWDIEPHLQ